MREAYCASMRQHIDSNIRQLNELRAIKRPLNPFETLAAERLIQVLIESCIGLAKHWVKAKGLGLVTDANRAFVLLEQYGEINTGALNWRKIIGMRNALVHDYLNLDTEVLLDIIQQKRYQDLDGFSRLAIKALMALPIKPDNTQE
jgi:uncharacterized protein YutE (UPF0331/DUF86 family)